MYKMTNICKKTKKQRDKRKGNTRINKGRNNNNDNNNSYNDNNSNNNNDLSIVSDSLIVIVRKQNRQICTIVIDRQREETKRNTVDEKEKRIFKAFSMHIRAHTHIYTN